MRGKPVNRRKIGSNAALWSALAGLVALAIPCARGAYDGTGTFTKITSRSDLTDGYYVVASSNGLQAMSNNNPERYFVDTPISPTADVLTDPSPTIVWLIQTNATYGGHTIFNEASNCYVVYVGTVNAAYAAAAVNGTTGVWTFAYGVGAFDVANVATPARMLQYNVNAPRFACYTTQQDKLTLYKMVPVGPSAPAFGTNPGPVSATVGTEAIFAVSATGSPAPVLALQATTASGGYSFTASSGTLAYTPPQADVDTTRTFTFTASNSVGVATQVVSVTVAPAPVYIPTVTVTNIGTNSFTLHWTEVTAATAYQVQVATDTNFTPGTAGGGLFISEVADPANNANARFVELYNASGAAIDFSTAVWYLSRQANGSSWGTVQLTGTLAADGTYVVANNQTNYEAAYYGDTADLYAAIISGNGDDGYFLYSGGDHVSGTLVDAFGVVNQDGTGFAWEYTDSRAVRDSAVTSPTSIWTSSEWTITSANVSDMTPHAHTVTGGGAGGGGTLVADLTVGALNTNVTGLEMETTYYIRVRAAPTGTWSSVVLATTTGGEATVPSFTSGAGPYSVTAGSLLEFTVSAMGTPVPVLALDASTASTNDYAFEPSTGYFLYGPPVSAGGTTQTFTFAASNSTGRATQVVTVNVTAVSAPVFGANPGPLTATASVARTFTVSATGDPKPELALRSATASGDAYSFTPATGLLSYTPPASDLGAQSFTFTASNVAGVATQAVSVTVVAPPTIDALSPLNIAVGQTSNLWIVAREAEGDVFTLTASNLPANATFSAVHGTGVISNLFSFSPASNQAGQAYAVVFYAGDADGTNSATLNIQVAHNDPWADYYAPCYSNGVLKTGNDLKQALHGIISGHTSFSYLQTENILKVIDECPTNSSMVQLIYLQCGRAKTSFGPNAGDWNREHVWANSHGINDNLPAYTDVHHLHPADVTVNSTRGNKDFDTVSGSPDTYSYNTTAFEPPDAGKGDVARAMFYMAVRYDGSDGVGDLELTNTLPTSGAWHGKLDTLMAWHELDPVNDYEIRRNNLIYSNYQGNRNPFVDHPEWVRVVFDTNYVAALPPPTAFAAAPNGPGQIRLTFTLNGQGDNVVIVWNADGQFGQPAGAVPAVGQPFAGGTVLYKGGSSPQSHTGLAACQTRHYACWSYIGTNYSQSRLTSSATTLGVAAPATVWASETNATDFTAAWGGVTGVSDYRLDVSTASNFVGGVFVAGYSNRVVSGATSAVVTGLNAGVTYYFRVASLPNCDGQFSPTGAVSIAAALTPYEQWLTGRGLNPALYAEGADSDGDGMTNYEEYLADTNPEDSNSVLWLQGRYWVGASAGAAGERMEFSFPASASRFYQLEYCTNLIAPVFSVTNLGWGIPPAMTVTNNSPASWYGVIRALLAEP
jgi:endonuclease I